MARILVEWVSTNDLQKYLSIIYELLFIIINIIIIKIIYKVIIYLWLNTWLIKLFINNINEYYSEDYLILIQITDNITILN